MRSNCFKCTTCGGFLKVGFYVIEDGKYHCKVRYAADHVHIVLALLSDLSAPFTAPVCIDHLGDVSP